MAEASVMASRNGVAAADLLDVLTNGIFPAPTYKVYGAAIAEKRYDPPAFRLSLTLKDMKLVLAAAEDARVPMPLAEVVHESLLEAVAHGQGDRDLAALAVVAMLRAGGEEIEAPSPGGKHGG
jgi:3-hydroxyisobutyrate dehydrogenase-like beta-hydroxyacid dehydrogenase